MPYTLEFIQDNASEIKEENLDAVVDDLLNVYMSKIKALAYYTYGRNDNIFPEPGMLSVAQRAFIEYSKQELKKALHTYLFVSMAWQENRDINSYLLVSLNRLSSRLKSEAGSIKKINAPICPACKVYDERSFLRYEGKLLRCDECANEIIKLEDILKQSLEHKYRALLEDRLNLHKIFIMHSRRGYRCPDCQRFIPESYVRGYGVSCCYDADCSWFGTSVELEIMAHPTGLTSRPNISLNVNVVNGKTNATSENTQLQDMIKSEIVGADFKVELQETYENELNILRSVITTQMDRLKANHPSEKVYLKLLMYQAYLNLINDRSSTEEMVSYLVHLKHSSSPVQSRIFQEFTRLTENALPFTIKKHNKHIEIYSLLDEDLNIFDGTSVFVAEVNDKFIIPNNTLETYVTENKDYGACFIGYLVDLVDLDTGKNLKDDIESYTFSEIKMKNNSVKVNTRVQATHFRLASHYELGTGLVLLQRIRRRIVDSVYFKLNKKKRIVKTITTEEVINDQP